MLHRKNTNKCIRFSKANCWAKLEYRFSQRRRWEKVSSCSFKVYVVGDRKRWKGGWDGERFFLLSYEWIIEKEARSKQVPSHFRIFLSFFSSRIRIRERTLNIEQNSKESNFITNNRTKHLNDIDLSKVRRDRMW